MKLHNLTDVSTAALENRGLVNASITIKGVVIRPGASAEIPTVPLSDIRTYMVCGALAEALPLAYRMAKMRPPARPHQEPRVDTPRPPIEARLSLDSSESKRSKRKKRR